MYGLRPIATNATLQLSLLSCCVLLSCKIKLIDDFDFFASLTPFPRLNFIPCFSKMALNLVAISASIPGKIRGKKSTTSTSAPRRDQTVPISRPIYPAPTTTSLFGNSESSRAPVEETICFSSIDIEARLVGSEPVAIIILSAFNSPLSRPSIILTTPEEVI